MIEWYYVLGIISYGIFIIQCLLYALGTDWDVDLDLDGNIDLLGSDLFSFKGITHFLMGFSGWLMATDYFKMETITEWTYIGAFLIGISFMIVLYFIYKFCLKANHEPTIIEDYSGASGVIQLSRKVENTYVYWIRIAVNFGYAEIKATSPTYYSVGTEVVIKEKLNGNYII